jgi:hypothetical protein
MTPDDKDAVLDLARADLTPDELPANMEAVVARLEVAAIDPAPWPDLRALLKAYQEQRRALKDLIDYAEECAARLDYHDACMMGDEPVQAARATLNQKGDER